MELVVVVGITSSHHQFVMPASGQSSVRSLAVVDLVTAIDTSLGMGFCTYFVTVHGKEKE